MSTPAGQSLAHALQDRHNSRDSATSGADQPPVTSEPFAMSCNTRARPRVVSFSSLVARNDGHMNPPAALVSARHLPTPTQRCTALVKSPPSWPNANPSRAGSGRARGRRRSASTGRGRTSTPGLSTSSGSNSALNAWNTARARSEYISDSSSPRARPSPCSPDSDPPCAATNLAASCRNARSTEPSDSSGMSMRTCTQPSPKCP